MRKTVVKTKFRAIEESLMLVEEHMPKTLEEFLELGLVKDGIYKRIEFCIENVFDICAIINTDLKLSIPGSDEDIIENLMRNNILSTEMKDKLKSMRGFRNILVHTYGKTDDALAFSILKEHSQDFYDFIEKIDTFIATVDD